MKLNFYYIFLVCAMLFAAEPEPVELESSADKAIITPEESLRFSIRLETKKGINLTIPEIGNEIQGFRIVDFADDPIKEEDERIIQRRWYELKADISGSYILPAVLISYVTEDGSQKEVKTSAIFVEVKASQTKSAEGEEAEAQDIRDIKGLQPFPYPWKTIILVIGIVVGLGLLLFGAWWYRRRMAFKRPVIESPPEDVALVELDRLKGMNLLEDGKIKQFHFRLSEISRTYFEKRYGLPATDMTVEEIERKIQSVSKLNPKSKEDYLRMLKQTDLVKFTDIKPPIEDSETLLKETEAFVKNTSNLEAKVSEEEPEAVI